MYLILHHTRYQVQRTKHTRRDCLEYRKNTEKQFSRFGLNTKSYVSGCGVHQCMKVPRTVRYKMIIIIILLLKKIVTKITILCKYCMS